MSSAVAGSKISPLLSVYGMATVWFMDVKLRFLKYVRVTDRCWEWIGCTNGNGYGTFSYLGKNRLAHRVSYIIHIGDIPTGKDVCHTCDNIVCVRPDHFFVGTNGDNTHDMMAKGRARFLRGEAHGNSKLNDNKVRNIRDQYARGESMAALARHYMVTPTTIRNVVLNKQWCHVV